MTAILNLTDGTTTINFVPASDYILLSNGLELELPDVKRTLGGDPFLGEGERLVDRQYGNREIGINFKIGASNHNALIADIRALVQLLDRAKKTAKEGFGPKVELHYKLDNATDEVIFDVLDGELALDRISSTETHRASILLGNKLLLICRPFARLSSSIEISNWLLNPGFEWNPSEGGIEGIYKADFAASDIFKHTVPTDFASSGVLPRMALGMWIDWTQQSTLMTLVLCGSTVKAYYLRIRADNKAEFTWFKFDDSFQTITSSNAIPSGKHFISVAQFNEFAGILTVLMIDGKVEGASSKATPGYTRTPTGNFYVGAENEAGLQQFVGSILSLFTTKDVNIFPNQMAYLHRFGVKGLYTAALTNPNYWGIEKDNFGGIWMFENDATDESGNGRTLTNIGSIPYSWHSIPEPESWTLGSAFESQLDSGLTVTSIKHGLRACHFERSAGIANYYIKQSPTLVADDYTVILWAKVTTGQIDIDFNSVNEGIAANGGVYKQYIKTFNGVSAGAIDFFIKRLTGSAFNADVDSVMLCRGKPFGTYSSFTDVTAVPKPFIGSKYIKAWPDADEVNWLDVYDIPGDVPATTRLRVKNKYIFPLAPMRIGAVFGREPWKQIFGLEASLLLPDYTNSSAYGTSGFPSPPVTTAVAADTLTDRIYSYLPALFPCPQEQYGSHKIYMTNERVHNMITLARMRTLLYEVPLSGDPIKDPTATSDSLHSIDCGFLNWPPEMAFSDMLLGKGSAHVRGGGAYYENTPSLVITNAADAAVAAPDVKYHHLFLLPIDGGYFTLQMAAASDKAGLAAAGEEILVIDTIDEDKFSVGYVEKELILPEGATRVPLLATPEMAMYGSGFKIEPNQPGAFVFQINRANAVNNPFGIFTEAGCCEAWLEYNPRFLYV